MCVYIAVLTMGAFGRSPGRRLARSPIIATGCHPRSGRGTPAWTGRWHSPSRWWRWPCTASSPDPHQTRRWPRPGRGGPARRRERAHPDRPRPARPAGALAHTITVKAGLARRLAQRGDDERAAIEIAEVEELSRSLARRRARPVSVTATSRSPASWPRPARCCAPRASSPSCRDRSTSSIRRCPSCSAG